MIANTKVSKRILSLDQYQEMFDQDIISIIYESLVEMNIGKVLLKRFAFRYPTIS